MAAWIASKDHPLTGRVLVNRLWQQHFGRGLVKTSEDFGAQGDRPTHPELLDWLAKEFVEPATPGAAAWSVKHVRRLIVASRTYRQASIPSVAAAKLDPDNALLSRANRKRLDGEAIRDAVLAAAGVLNVKAGGPGVYPELPAEIKPASWPVSADAAERERRSVYVAVKRNLRYPLFAAFDSPDRSETCSRRFATTTAPQALALLNDPLLHGYAKKLAARR